LSPEHRKEGYSIRVGHREHPDGGTQIMANLFHHTTKVGEVHGLAAVGSEMNDEGTAWNYKDLNTLRLNTSQVHEAHRGKGLGTALYESTLAHAHNHLGVQQVEGARHSSMASGTHAKVSQKHGLGYQPKLHPNASPDAPKQAYDGKFDNYRYALKSESDVKQILKSEEFSLEDSFDSEESEKSLDEVSGEESSVVEELVQEGKVTIKGVNS
jgi:GNAT superfamily N-acetyltransferase